MAVPVADFGGDAENLGEGRKMKLGLRVSYIVCGWLGVATVRLERDSACAAVDTEGELRRLGWRTSLRRVVAR